MFDVRKSAWALGLLLGLTGASAQAQTNLSGTENPSLILLIWDPVAKVSYSRDTGLYGATLYNGLLDAGSQRFWTIDPATDASFAQFSQKSTNLSQDVWMVIGGGKSDAGVTAGTNVVFSTMINTLLGDDGQPVLNPQWPYLTGVTNLTLRQQTVQFGNHLYGPLGAGNGTAYNSYATAPTGSASSYDTSASNAYVGNMQPVLSDGPSGLLAGDAMFGGTGAGGFDAGNLIGAAGSSSWFYYLTPSATDPRKALNNSAITVSAFANSAQNAYWGLARTTNSSNQQELVLSFTLPAAIVPTATLAGTLRRNQTDYTAQYGSVLQIAGRSEEFAGWTPSALLMTASVTAVPEPESVLMMLLGLGGVLVATRRSRRTDLIADQG